MGDFVADLAKRRLRNGKTDNQGSNAYPSFTVRLSFVYSSLNLRDSWGVLEGRMGETLLDYEQIVVLRANGGRSLVFLKNSQFGEEIKGNK